jgi:hypothetical protein
VLDLLTADYTYANERVARHYGIPNVTGSEFRRVMLPADRRGILGQGSILTLTSIAERDLAGAARQVGDGSAARLSHLRRRHRMCRRSKRPRARLNPAVRSQCASAWSSIAANPQCTSCHRVIDPLGLALENFDATGKWRIRDGGMTVDTKGAVVSTARRSKARMASARRAVAPQGDVILLSFTRSLMTYALGRRVEAFDMPSVAQDHSRRGKAQNYRISAFVTGIVESEPSAWRSCPPRSAR